MKIQFKDDVVETYAKGRKNMPKKEAEDLLNCLLSYMRHITRSDEHYAIKIPNIGFLYTKDTVQRENRYITDMTNNTFLSKMFIEKCYETNTKRGYSLLDREGFFNAKSTREELKKIQENQNN